MVFSEINAGISLFERLRKWWYARRKPPVESIATRFIRLFESHGVHRNQIPRFIGHGLTMKDVQDEESLLAKLDEPLLEAVCKKFAVRREWLDGAEDQVHPCHDFYKYPEKFEELLKKLMAENPDGDWHAVLVVPEKKEDKAALLILQETIDWIGEKPIYRCHLIHNWRFGYWKSRAYLTACVAIAWKYRCYVLGKYLPEKEIRRLEEGQTLLGWSGDGIWGIHGERWYAEDMALEPAVFLDGVDPERDNFGIAAALSLWLELEKDGMMNVGVNKNARELFEAKLAQYM